MERRGVEAGRSGEEKREEEVIFHHRKDDKDDSSQVFKYYLFIYFHCSRCYCALVANFITVFVISCWSRANSNLVTNDLVTFLLIDLFIVDLK